MLTTESRARREERKVVRDVEVRGGSGELVSAAIRALIGWEKERGSFERSLLSRRSGQGQGFVAGGGEFEGKAEPSLQSQQWRRR